MRHVSAKLAGAAGAEIHEGARAGQNGQRPLGANWLQSPALGGRLGAWGGGGSVRQTHPGTLQMESSGRSGSSSLGTKELRCVIRGICCAWECSSGVRCVILPGEKSGRDAHPLHAVFKTWKKKGTNTNRNIRAQSGLCDRGCPQAGLFLPQDHVGQRGAPELAGEHCLSLEDANHPRCFYILSGCIRSFKFMPGHRVSCHLYLLCPPTSVPLLHQG